jgi:hypothetical protein
MIAHFHLIYFQVKSAPKEPVQRMTSQQPQVSFQFDRMVLSIKFQHNICWRTLLRWVCTFQFIKSLSLTYVLHCSKVSFSFISFFNFFFTFFPSEFHQYDCGCFKQCGQCFSAGKLTLFISPPFIVHFSRSVIEFNLVKAFKLDVSYYKGLFWNFIRTKYYAELHNIKFWIQKTQQ